MNDLIKINYETEQPTVSARDLHEKLNIGTKFTTWFERMKEYGFTEGNEFSQNWEKPRNKAEDRQQISKFPLTWQSRSA